MKIRYPPKVEGLFVMNYYLIEVAGDFEPKTKTKCSNFSVPKGGMLSAFAGWDLGGGAGADGGSHRGISVPLSPATS